MRVLVLGGGGREHALCWALARSASVTEVLCAPGNAGIASLARLCEVDPTDIAMIRETAVREAVDLVVVGPEGPLVAGVADTLAVAGVPVFGPPRSAAGIESSKTFAKQVMAAAGVPTGAYWSGADPAAARAALRRFAPPYVVKADGLAAGKGVRICADLAEASQAVDDALVGGRFGAAGETVVIEEFLEGPELSVFAVCGAAGERGEGHVVIGAARDYKRALDGDRGQNTGGMGAYTPVPAFTDALREQVSDTILAPTLDELSRRGLPYRGLLYAGIVLTAEGPKVLEFNARFGDPEAQALLPCLPGDLGALLAAAAAPVSEGGLTGAPAIEGACVTVVLASGGYPGEYETGMRISGLDEAAASPGALVFHAGTRREGRHIVTAGGRVLAVSGLGGTLAEARAAAYAAADLIEFDSLHRRNDIAAETGWT